MPKVVLMPKVVVLMSQVAFMFVLHVEELRTMADGVLSR
jgi:hypothetical protein